MFLVVSSGHASSMGVERVLLKGSALAQLPRVELCSAEHF